MNKKLAKSLTGSVLAILELLLAVVILLFLAQRALNAYFKPLQSDKKNRELTGQGIDTASHRTIVDSTKERVGDFSRQIKDHEKQIEEMQ